MANLTMMKTTTKTSKLDLNALQDVVFKDLDRLLESLNVIGYNKGQNYSGVCPIHNGDSLQAFSIRGRNWKCWTHNCHETYNSNIFGLVKGVISTRENREVEFREVLKYILRVYNLDGRDLPKVEVEESPYSEFCETVKTYNKQNTKEKLGVNYVPRGSTIKDVCLSPYFLERGYSSNVLQEFGVFEFNKRPPSMPFRCFIPIHSPQGKEISYILRATKPFILPKFIFSLSASAIVKGFKSSEYLYNYHRAIQTAQEKSCMFIMEGQGDVWRLWECGVYNCVSLFGKEISAPQLSLLLNSGITKIVVLLDSDQPGREAKVKIQRQLSRFFSLSFPQLTLKDIGEMTIEGVQNEILPQVKGLY